MKRARYLSLVGFAIVCAFSSAIGQESDVIRPTGVPEPLSTPRPKKHVRHFRAREEETPVAEPQKLAGGIPARDAVLE